MLREIFIGVVCSAISGAACRLIKMFAASRLALGVAGTAGIGGAAAAAAGSSEPAPPAGDAPPPPQPVVSGADISQGAATESASAGRLLMVVLARVHPLYAAVGGFFGYQLGRLVAALFFSDPLSLRCIVDRTQEPYACYQFTPIGYGVIVVFVLAGAAIGGFKNR